MAARLASTRVFQSLVRRPTVTCQNKSIITSQTRCISLACHAYKRYFTEDHEWVDVEDNIGTVGITDFAQGRLGDIVFVELPEVDEKYDQTDAVGVVESVKAVSDVLSPLTGVVTEVNEALNDSAHILNKNPEDEGWMFKMKISDASELDGLMDAEKYKKHIEESD